MAGGARAGGLMATGRPVLVVSNHGELIGGGEVSLLALLAEVEKSRWAPTVVVPSEGAVAERCRALGLAAEVVPLPGLRRAGPAMLRSVLALWRLTRRTGAVLLHANGSRAMCYAGLAARLARRPVLWHVRVADSDGGLDRLLFRLASVIVVNSKAVGRRFAWAPPGKVRCVYNGVDLGRFSPRQPPAPLRAALGLPEHARVAVSIGRFVAFKGTDHLLEAAGLVRAARADVHWLLVGEGELREDLEAQCRRLGLASYVHFLGWREDVPDLLALGDLLVLPSLGEHFGRVLIEAMAMARPVVATAAGGVPEIVTHGETGLLVPPADPKAIAEAVLALLEDPGRSARLGQAGRRRAEREFSLRRHAEAVERLYEELLGAGRAGL